MDFGGFALHFLTILAILHFFLSARPAQSVSGGGGGRGGRSVGGGGGGGSGSHKSHVFLQFCFFLGLYFWHFLWLQTSPALSVHAGGLGGGDDGRGGGEGAMITTCETIGSVALSTVTPTAALSAVKLLTRPRIMSTTLRAADAPVKVMMAFPVGVAAAQSCVRRLVQLRKVLLGQLLAPPLAVLDVGAGPAAAPVPGARRTC